VRRVAQAYALVGGATPDEAELAAAVVRLRAQLTRPALSTVSTPVCLAAEGART